MTRLHGTVPSARERAAQTERGGEPYTPQHAVLLLQAAAGNAATMRALQRQPVDTGAPNVSFAEPEGANVSYAEPDAPNASYGPDDPAATSYPAEPQLSPADQRKLAYARSILSRVEPLPKDDEQVLRKLVPGTLILQLIQQRDDAATRLQATIAEQERRLGQSPAQPSDRWMGKTDPVGDPDMIGDSSTSAGTSIGSVIEDQRKEVERLDAAIKQACQAIGIPDEKSFKELVESRFPDLFLARAKTVALKMLDENERLVRAEAKRFGVDIGPWEGTGAGSRASAPPEPAEVEAIAGMKAGAKELAELEAQITTSWAERIRVNEENKQLADDEGMDWDTGGGFWAPELSPESAPTAAAHQQRQAAFTQRRNELGLKYPILFRVSDYAGLANASDNELRRTTGTELQELLANIATTRENIADGDLKVWNLNEVFQITMQDLGITPDSPLYVSVAKRVEREERKESIIKIAMAAINIVAAIVAALPTAGASLVVFGTTVAVGTGVWQLSKSVGAFMAESAAGDVALDPAIADISRNSPDMKAVALDVAALGLDAFDVVRVVKLIEDPIRAARRTGDLVQLGKQLRAVPELGENGARAVMASVGREAEIQAGIVRIVRAIGTHFHPADLAQVISDLRRFEHHIVAHALEDLMSAGKIRMLSREAFDEVYAKMPQWKQGLIDHGYLRPTVEGLYGKRHGVLFLKPATFESLGGVAVHEVTHHLQKVHRPLMSTFQQEFEAYAAQRHYLQRLVASGIDPDMAFPTHKWLLEASNKDIVDHVARVYNAAPHAGMDLENAVFDAIVGARREHSLVEVGEAVGALKGGQVTD